jgi:hypothetical protein
MTERDCCWAVSGKIIQHIAGKVAMPCTQTWLTHVFPLFCSSVFGMMKHLLLCIRRNAGGLYANNYMHCLINRCRDMSHPLLG